MFVSHIGDFLDEDLGLVGDAPPGQNQREWQRGYIGRPSQRKTSNCEVSAQTRTPQGRELEWELSSFLDSDKPGSDYLKGYVHKKHNHHYCEWSEPFVPKHNKWEVMSLFACVSIRLHLTENKEGRGTKRNVLTKVPLKFKLHQFPLFVWERHANKLMRNIQPDISNCKPPVKWGGEGWGE